MGTAGFAIDPVRRIIEPDLAPDRLRRGAARDVDRDLRRHEAPVERARAERVPHLGLLRGRASVEDVAAVDRLCGHGKGQRGERRREKDLKPQNHASQS